MSEDTDSQNLEELVFSHDDRRVSFVVDEAMFSRDVVFGAAYLFVDRCWVFLSSPSAQEIEVRLTSRNASVSEEELRELAGEFANELLNQGVRTQVGEKTAQIREYYLARAFFSDPNQSSIDALLAELDAEELEDDELEISVPWE